MSNFRVILLVVLGVALINAMPTIKSSSKQTTKPTTKLPLKSSLKSKTLVTEEKRNDGPTKRDLLAIESAEELKKADRTKKSATTTFCVEIRPTPGEEPTKICEPSLLPPIQHEHHLIHENQPLPLPVSPPSPPTLPPAPDCEQQPGMIVVNPPQPDPEPCVPVQQNSIGRVPVEEPVIRYIPFQQQQTIVPCLPPTIHSLLHKHHNHPGRLFQATNTLFYSRNGSPAVSPIDTMMRMRMNDNSGINQLDGPKASSIVDVQRPTPIIVEHSADVNNHFDNVPQPSQMTVTNYQQPRFLGSCDSGFTAGQAGGATGGVMQIDNASGQTVVPHMSMDMPSASTRVYQPIHSVFGPPSVGYMSSPSMYQPPIYQNHARNYDPYYGQSASSMTAGRSPYYRRDHQIRHQRQQSEDVPEKDDNDEKTSEQMSPSKMLNQMRGQEAEKTGPTMQTFPRVNDDDNDRRTHINVHIPSSGQPIVTTTGPKNTINEDKLDFPRRGENAKRQVESVVSEKN